MTNPDQPRLPMEELLITNPPIPEPRAKPNWINEELTLKAISGDCGTKVTKYNFCAGDVAHVAAIHIMINGITA